MPSWALIPRVDLIHKNIQSHTTDTKNRMTLINGSHFHFVCIFNHVHKSVSDVSNIVSRNANYVHVLTSRMIPFGFTGHWEVNKAPFGVSTGKSVDGFWTTWYTRFLKAARSYLFDYIIFAKIGVPVPCCCILSRLTTVHAGQIHTALCMWLMVLCN